MAGIGLSMVLRGYPDLSGYRGIAALYVLRSHCKRGAARHSEAMLLGCREDAGNGAGDPRCSITSPYANPRARCARGTGPQGVDVFPLKKAAWFKQVPPGNMIGG
jgi:hypothetical protein